MNAPLFINPNRLPLDETYMQMAEIWAKRSKANRLQVGALIVKDQQIISDGYNGMPSGVEDDVCEYWHAEPFEEGGASGEHVLRTKPEVLHAESNALLKISKNGGTGAEGGTLYTTYSPCPECAKLIKQAKIARVVYRNEYRLIDGILLLRKLGVAVDRLGGDPRQHIYAPVSAPYVAPPPPPAVARQPIIPRSPPPPVSPTAPQPAAPPPAAPAPAIIPPRGGPTAEEEAEVAALLAQWEASQATAPPANQPKNMPDTGGAYKSSFT